MTVYSINKRILEQASLTTAGTKSSSGAADQFLAALNQAESKISVNSSATVSASTDEAFKQAFAHKDDATRQTTKTEDKSKRTEAKSQDRDDKTSTVRDTKQADDTQTRPTAKEAAKDAKDDRDDAPKAQDDTTAAAVGNDDQPAVAAQDDEAATEIVAAVVQVQQQVVEATPAAAEDNAPQVVAASAPEKIADAGNKPQQGPQNDQPVDDGAKDGDVAPVIDASAGDQNTPKARAHQAATDAAAKAQADDLAAELDDTGAQVNVAVSVKTEAPRPIQPTTGTAEVLLTQDVDGAQVQPANSGNGGQSGNQTQANAGNAQQVAAQAQGAQQTEQPVDAKPFAAILAAAQAEAANQPQAAGGTSQSTQTVAGLGGATGTAGAAKSAAAQTAQAARPQQLPQAKEIVDQVKVQIAKQGANGDTIKVQLKPVEMGSIEVKLDVSKDGSVSGVVTADNKDTLAMLKNDSRTLEKALSDAGFKTDAGSLTFNLRGDGQQQTASQDQNSSRRSRRALAALNGLDATQSGALAAQAQARSAGGRSGVDIQV